MRNRDTLALDASRCWGVIASARLDLRAVDTVVARGAQYEVGFQTARAQDADEGVDPGTVGAPFPTRDDRLGGTDRRRQGGLRQPGGATGGPDQLAEIRPGERISESRELRS